MPRKKTTAAVSITIPLARGVNVAISFSEEDRPFISWSGTNLVIDSAGSDTRKPETRFPAVVADPGAGFSPSYDTPEIAEARRVLDAKFAKPEKVMTPSIPAGFDVGMLLDSAPSHPDDEDA